MSVWQANPDLMARLTRAQNHPANVRSDIVTFAGFCDSRDELARHVERYEAAAIHHEGVEAVARALRPRRTRKAA